MKKIITGSLIAILNTSAYAANPVPGWYAGALIGVNSASGSNFQITPPTAGVTVPTNISLDYKYYANGALSLGYRCDHYRLEGEALYAKNPLSKLVINGLTIESLSSSAGLRVSGSQNIMSLMFNGYYDINLISNGSESDFIPYVGLGLGYAQLKNNTKLYFNNALIPGSQITGKSSSPAGQFILGGNYFMDDFWSVGLDYRYFTSKEHKDTHSKAQFQSINLVMTAAFDSVLG